MAKLDHIKLHDKLGIAFEPTNDDKCRPSLLSEQEFLLVPAGINKLALVFGEADRYASIVQMFPNVLLLDAEDLLSKLQQQLGLDITPNVVLQDPSLLMSVADNRSLSIW